IRVGCASSFKGICQQADRIVGAIDFKGEIFSPSLPPFSASLSLSPNSDCTSGLHQSYVWQFQEVHP
ncbi:MAG: hypothetical protein ACJ0DI_11760, partial [bacterium]